MKLPGVFLLLAVAVVGFGEGFVLNWIPSTSGNGTSMFNRFHQGLMENSRNAAASIHQQVNSQIEAARAAAAARFSSMTSSLSGLPFTGNSSLGNGMSVVQSMTSTGGGMASSFVNSGQSAFQGFMPFFG